MWRNEPLEAFVPQQWAFLQFGVLPSSAGVITTTLNGFGPFCIVVREPFNGMRFFFVEASGKRKAYQTHRAYFSCARKKHSYLYQFTLRSEPDDWNGHLFNLLLVQRIVCLRCLLENLQLTNFIL
ncbi:Uncharacterised protein [Citrobacter koseri]|uniref:Uncharacterized protein n=1 Tax=Citrobacter koseri TaxID=545 RepID=A0A2X2WFT5_CITKO|nr:Uncharacterised protein [Citrobacter koseri]